MSKIVVMSSNGQVQLVDTADMGSENLDIFQVLPLGAQLLCIKTPFQYLYMKSIFYKTKVFAEKDFFKSCKYIRLSW